MEEKYIKKMKEFEKRYENERFYDIEDIHEDYDNCILEFLEEMGYNDIAKYYRESNNKYGFWYD